MHIPVGVTHCSDSYKKYNYKKQVYVLVIVQVVYKLFMCCLFIYLFICHPNTIVVCYCIQECQHDNKLTDPLMLKFVEQCVALTKNKISSLLPYAVAAQWMEQYYTSGKDTACIYNRRH